MKTHNLLSIALFFIMTTAQAQVAVDHSTGTANVSIPLYSISGYHMDFDIMLGYQATGIAVADPGGSVGHGWELVGLGSVDRQIRGLHDDQWPTEEVAKAGYLWCSHFFQDETGGFDPSQEWLDKISEGEYDLQPDKFVVSAPGLDGTFYFLPGSSQPEGSDVTVDSEIVFAPHREYELEYTIDDGQIISFVITNELGNKYFFDAIQEMKVTSFCQGNQMGIQEEVELSYVSSWYLTRIEDYNGLPEVEAEYASTGEEIVVSVQQQFHTSPSGQVLSASPNGVSVSPYCPGANVLSHCFNTLTYSPVKLMSVSSRNTSVIFDYDTPRLDFPGDQLLSTVTLIKNGNIFSKFLLEYDEIFDPAVCLYDECRRPVLSSVTALSDNNSPINNPITFEYFEGGLPHRSSIDIDAWGFYNFDAARGHNESLIPLTTFEEYNTFWLTSRSPNLESTRIGSLRKINNPLGGSTELDYELHDFSEYHDGSVLLGESSHAQIAEAHANYSLDDPDETVLSDPFEVSESGTYRFYVDIFAFGNYDNGYPSAQIIDVSDNSVAFEFESGMIELFVSGNRYPDVWQDITLDPGTYQLKCQSEGWTSPIPDYMVKAELFEIDIADQNPIQQKLAGGLRIKSVIYDDGDDDSSNNIQQQYSYSQQGLSTGIMLSSSLPTKLVSNNLDYYTTASFYVFGDGCPDPCVFEYDDHYDCEYTTLLSTSTTESVTHHGSPLIYEQTTVTEMNEGLPQGYTRYSFSRGSYSQDMEVPLIPETSGTVTIGNPIKTSVYDSDDVLLSELEYEYESIDLQESQKALGLAVESTGLEGAVFTDIDHAEQFMEQDQDNAALGSTIQALPVLAFQGPIAAAGHLLFTGVAHLVNNRIQNTNEAEISINDQSYNVYATENYNIEAEVFNLVKVYNRTYDPLQPSRFIEDVIEFEYHEGSTSHPQLVTNYRTGLDEKRFQTWTYVDDFNISEGTSPEADAIVALGNKGAKKVIIESIHSLGPDLESSAVYAGSSSAYFIDANDHIVIDKEYVLYPPTNLALAEFNAIEVLEDVERSPHYDAILEIEKHDEDGTPVEWNQPFGPSQAALTHPESGQLLASAQPAQLEHLAYTSFEDAFHGGWTYNQNSQPEETVLHKGFFLPKAKTGLRAYTLTNSQITRPLTIGEFIISMWSQGQPELTVLGSGTVELILEDAADELGWVYREYLLAKEDEGPSTLFIGSNESCLIDELRFYPRDAHMNTWTYDQLDRLRTRTDLNGRATQLLYSDNGSLEFILNDQWEVRERNISTNKELGDLSSRHSIESIVAKESTLVKNDFSQANVAIEDGTLHSMSFFDGMGRLVQQQMAKASSWNRNVLRHSEYDALGRQSRIWEPFTVANSEQQFIEDPTPFIESFYASTNWVAETDFPYSEFVFDDSPLDRIEEIGAPGAEWQLGQHSRQNILTVNGPQEVLKWSLNEESISAGGIIPEYYPESALLKLVQSDEDGKTTEYFTDQEGNLILKRRPVWSYNTPQYSYTADFSDGQDPESNYPEPVDQNFVNQDTYYVYNPTGSLVAEIGPQGIEQLGLEGNFFISTNNGVNAEVFGKCVFHNHYDERGRVIESKSPDQVERSFVYNVLDQVVMFQNSYQVDEEELNWQVIVHDVHGRPVMGGFTTTEQSRENLQEIWSVQTENLWEVRDGDMPFGYTEPGAFTIEQAHAILFFDERGNADQVNIFEGDEALTPRTRGELLIKWSEVQDESGDHLVTSFFLNKRGRVCQAVEGLLLDGTDRLSYEYDFEGRLTEVNRVQSFGGIELNIHNTLEYGDLGQLTTIKQRTGSDPEIVLAKYMYNELGQLVKEHLHIGVDDNTGMQTIDYRYNPRGWLRKINNSNLVDDGDNLEDYDVFGEEIIYTANDQLQPWGGTPFNSLNAIQAEELHSGLVSAVKWNTKSPDEAPGLLREKCYTYRYDDLGRMTGAAFAMENLALGSDDYGQFTTSKNAFLESVQYDLNDNLRRIRRNKPNFNWSAPESMDDLQISFSPSSNQGSEISDSALLPGDASFSQFVDNEIATDRTFDNAGFLIEDHNNSMVYEYDKLGLISSIVHDDFPEAAMTIVHDAGGRLLKTVVVDTIHYFMNGIEYLDTGNGIEFVAAGTKVGAVREKEDFELNTTEYVYDYFIKDHLGNVRVIITEGNSVQVTEQVTMEVVNASEEESQFENVEESRSPTPLSYPDASLANQKVAELSANSSIVGPGKLIRVRRGDVVDVSADSWYQGYSADNPMTSIGDILTAIATGMLTQGGEIIPNGEIGTEQLLDPNSSVNGGIATFLNNELNESDWNSPMAYLVYLTFTDDLRLIPALSGTVGLGDEGVVELLEAPEVLINGDGYFYAFVTNYSEQSVSFDNFTLVHQQGKIRGEYDYYPYGLLWYNPSANEEYNQTYQSKLWMHGTWGDEGVDVYDFHARLHDPVLASWQTPDPMNQFTSPYTTMASNPVSHIDPDGMYSFPIGRWFRRLFGRTPSTGQRLVGSHQGSFITTGFLGNIALGTSSGIASVMAESQRLVLENADRLAADAVDVIAYSDRLYRIQYNAGSLLIPRWVDYQEGWFVNQKMPIKTATGSNGSITGIRFTMIQSVTLSIANNSHQSALNPEIRVEVIPSKLRSSQYTDDSQTYAKLYTIDGFFIQEENAAQRPLPPNSMGSSARKAAIPLAKFGPEEWGKSYKLKVVTNYAIFRSNNLLTIVPDRVVSRFRIVPIPPRNAPNK